MAKCGICKLNPGGLPWRGCPYEGRGCYQCPEKCTNKAVYIGGINICQEHKEAHHNRLEKIFPIKIDNVFVKTSWGWQKKLAEDDEKVCGSRL
jgi:hypothetical protein